MTSMMLWQNCLKYLEQVRQCESFDILKIFSDPKAYVSGPSMNDESSDSEESDDGEDNELMKPPVSRKISIASSGNAQNDARMSEVTPAGRIASMFEQSVAQLVDAVVRMSDEDPRKLELLGQTIQQIRILKSEVQYNAHMAILSTINLDSIDCGELSTIQE